MRLFIAVPVPQEIRDRIAAAGMEIAGPGVNAVSSGKMHITLKFIGETNKKAEIVERLGTIKFKKFQCTAKGVGVFPSERYAKVVWAGIESGGALENLAELICDQLKEFGVNERFSAHITIARIKRKIDFNEFIKKHSKTEFGSFEVTSFALMQSTLEKVGSKYEKMAQFEGM